MIDWERLATALKLVILGTFAITLLVAGIVWFVDKCQEDDNYKIGCVIFVILVILVGIVYGILGVI